MSPQTTDGQRWPDPEHRPPCVTTGGHFYVETGVFTNYKGTTGSRVEVRERCLYCNDLRIQVYQEDANDNQ